MGADIDIAGMARSNGDRSRRRAISLAKRAIGSIFIFDGEELKDAVRFPLQDFAVGLDRFSDGRWLVVTARTQGESNARIISPEGSLQSAIFLGNGIQHVKIDSLDRIWVGWFDEGVFGNRTWQVSGMEWPPSSYGVACFDESGSLLEHAGAGPSAVGIADCYSMNVTGKTAWACTYTEFPIVRLGNGEERWWPTSLRGPKAIAVASDLVLAAGGHGDGNIVTLLRLDNESAFEIGRWRLPFLDVLEWQSFALMEGRGDTLHLVAQGQWHRWNVQDFAAISAPR